MQIRPFFFALALFFSNERVHLRVAARDPRVRTEKGPRYRLVVIATNGRIKPDSLTKSPRSSPLVPCHL